MYSFIRKLLFKLDPEQSHYLTLNCLRLVYKLGLLKLFYAPLFNPRMVMGLNFQNPIGLAAGLDKDADYVDALAALGFGFIEIGTVTPKPQRGNPKPRLFRLIREKAIINRMGFNSKGADYVVQQLQKIKYRGILGINIGKNKDTPNDKAIDDYVFGFRTFWQYASYITINISSPNTQGLRDLQQGDALLSLLTALKQEQKIIAEQKNKYVPLVVKIAPDLTENEVNDIATILLQTQIDGVIATNTTLSRAGVENSVFAHEAGGLSGAPFTEKSTAIITQLYALLQHRIPIIGVGGIMDVKSAQEKFTAGAQLLQIYTGFIYEGPVLIQQLVKHLP